MWILWVFVILASAYFLLRAKRQPNIARRFHGLKVAKSYDYIVVGSGSAGSFLTSKLVQAKKSNGQPVTVLLLEAGPEHHVQDYLRREPWKWLGNIMSFLDWDFVSVPQKFILGRQLWVSRGKTTGGSSAVNAQMWVRGCPQDYDRWAEESGDQSWSFKSLIPIWKSMENYDEGSDQLRGRDGPIVVRKFGQESSDLRKILETIQKGGFKDGDYNGEDHTDVASFTQENCGNHVRGDTFTAFVEPLLNKSNLTVVSCAHVQKILFEEKRAVGVEVYFNEKLHTIQCNNEVIVCAGAIQSPQLLMLSGVGPADHLKELNIKVVHDNPNVGANLIDHPSAPVVIQLKSPFEIDEYNGNGLGVTAFYQSSWSKKNTSKAGADMQIATGGGAILRHFGPRALFTPLFKDSIPHRDTIPGKLLRNGSELIRPIVNTVLRDKLHSVINVGVVCNQPKSKGTIRLKSANPYDDPIIDPHFLENDADIQRLVEGVKKVRTIFQNGPFAERVDKVLKPEAQVTSDSEIADHVRRTAFAAWHPVGTCKMSKGSDAVVDSRLRVVGVQNLRVADASIMPYIVSANTNMASIVIGGRGGDVIVEDLKDKKE